MMFTLGVVASACALFAGMVLCFEMGRRIGLARLARDPEGLGKGSGPIEASIFGLLGLLLAFTFSGAAARFEARRHLIGQEANAIGTAYLRLDLLPAESEPEIRRLFRLYLETREEAYRHVEDAAATEARRAETATLQGRIWTAAASATQRPDASPQLAILLLPALNEMIDITTTRSVAIDNHPPRIIFLLLAGLSLASALLVGYVMCGTHVRSWFYMLLLASTLSLTFYVILDLEYPRYGLIRIDAADQTLIDLEKSIR